MGSIGLSDTCRRSIESSLQSDVLPIVSGSMPLRIVRFTLGSRHAPERPLCAKSCPSQSTRGATARVSSRAVLFVVRARLRKIALREVLRTPRPGYLDLGRRSVGQRYCPQDPRRGRSRATLKATPANPDVQKGLILWGFLEAALKGRRGRSSHPLYRTLGHVSRLTRRGAHATTATSKFADFVD